MVVPVHNEADSISEALNRIFEALEGENYRVIVVDDGSSDDTLRVVQGITSPRLSCLVLEANGGKGAALKAGFRAVGGEYFAYIDGDLDLHPEGLILGLNKLRSTPSVHAAIGSKLHKESRVSYSLGRRILSKLYRGLVQHLFDVGVSDSQTGLKVFRTQEVLPICLQARSDGWAFDLEILVRMRERGFGVLEIPVNLEYKFSTSLSIVSACHALFETLRAFWLIKFNSRT